MTITERQLDIADMQCRAFHMAQKRWNLSPAQCAELFEKYGLLGYISECYDLLHTSGYEHLLDDLEEILETDGVTVCKS